MYKPFGWDSSSAPPRPCESGSPEIEYNFNDESYMVMHKLTLQKGDLTALNLNNCTAVFIISAGASMSL